MSFDANGMDPEAGPRTAANDLDYVLTDLDHDEVSFLTSPEADGMDSNARSQAIVALTEWNLTAAASNTDPFPANISATLYDGQNGEAEGAAFVPKSKANAQQQGPVVKRANTSRKPAPTGECPDAKTTALVMTSVLLALFLTLLDQTIIATALPQITNEFHSLGDIGWYGSAFMLTACCMQLLMGRVYTFNTPKYVFLTVVLIFEIGSAVCGSAPNSIAFIFGRAIAGIGSAGTMSGAVVLMTYVIPLPKRPLYQGLFASVSGVASVVGPLLGGAFTTNLTWRWCFYINLPVGGIALVVILFALKPDSPRRPGFNWRQQLAEYDLLGSVFLLPCLVCLLLVLQWGGSQYPWNSARIIVLFVLFGALLVAFVVVQIFKGEKASFPTRIITNRSMIASMWFVFFLISAMMVMTYFTPTWFQAIKGVSAVKSGIMQLALLMSLVVAAIFAGVLTNRIGYYTPLVYASSVVMPVGAGLISTWKVATRRAEWIGYQIIFGAGLGLGMQQSLLAAQTVLKPPDVPYGVAMVVFMQRLGGAIFISAGQTVLTSNLIKDLTKAFPHLSPEDIVNVGATDLRNAVSSSELPTVLVIYDEALRQVFLMATALACIASIGATGFEWRSVKKAKGLPPKPPT